MRNPSDRIWITLFLLTALACSSKMTSPADHATPDGDAPLESPDVSGASAREEPILLDGDRLSRERTVADHATPGEHAPADRADVSPTMADEAPILLYGDRLSRKRTVLFEQLRAAGFEAATLAKIWSAPSFEGRVRPRKVIEKLAEMRRVDVRWLAGRAGAVLWRQAPPGEKEAILADLASEDPVLRRSAIRRAVRSEDAVVFLRALEIADTDNTLADDAAAAIYWPQRLCPARLLDRSRTEKLHRRTMTHPDPKVRTGAYRAIDRDCGAEWLPVLTAGLQDSSVAVREQALLAARRLDLPETELLAFYERALSDETDVIRKKALGEIRRHPGPQALRILESCVDDASTAVAKCALRELGARGGEEAAEMIARALVEKPAYAGEALQALRRAGGAQAAKILEGAARSGEAETRSAALLYYAELVGAGALEVVERATSDENERVRLAALRSLQDVGSGEALRILGRFLVSSDRRARSTASYSLLRIGSPEALQVLALGLRSQDKAVRAAAAMYLWDIENLQAVPLVMKALKDRSADVRMKVLRALTWMGSEDMERAAGRALKDSDKAVRRETLTVLGSIRNSESVALLAVALGDHDAELRKLAVEKLCSSDCLSAVPHLIAALPDAKWFIRSKAAHGLAQFRAPQVRAAILERLAVEQERNVRSSLMNALRKNYSDEEVTELIRKYDAEKAERKRRARTGPQRVDKKEEPPPEPAEDPDVF